MTNTGNAAALSSKPIKSTHFASYLIAVWFGPNEIAPELTGHGLPLSKCEAYNRVYDQPSESH